MASDPEPQAHDLNFRMSKKVAQLTKVIYQLNCRNEDSESTMRNLAETYESEIAEVMNNARSKINGLQEQLTAKREDRRTQQMVEALTRQHTKEKDEAMRAFEAWKAKQVQAETEMKRTIEQRNHTLATEVANLKSDYAKKLEELKTARAALEKKNGADVESLRKLKETEMEKMVQEYNEKYKAMLRQQMDERDVAEKEVNAEWQAKFDKAAKQAAEKLQAEQNRAKADSERYGEMVRALEAKVDTLESKLKEAGANAMDAERREFDLKKRIEDLLNQSAQTGDSLNTTIKKLNDQLEAVASTLRETEAALAKSNEVVRKRDTTITSLENELGLLRADKDRIENELNNLRSMSADASSQANSLGGQLADAQSKNRSLEATCDAQTQKIASLEASVAELKEKVSGLEDALRRERSEAQGTKSRLEAALAQAKADGEAKLATLKNSMSADADARHTSEIADLKQQHADEVDRLKKEHASELDEKLKSLRDDLTGKADAAATAATKTQSELQSRINVLEAELNDKAAAAAAANAAGSEQATKLQQRVTELEELIAKTTKANADAVAEWSAKYDSLKTETDKQIAALNEEKTALKRDLEKERARADAAEGDAASARSDLARERSRFEDELAEQHQKFSAKLSSSSGDQERRAAEDRKRALDALRAELTSAHNAQIAKLKAESDAQQRQANMKMGELKEQIEALRTELRKKSDELAGLQSATEDERRRASAAHDSECEKVVAEFAAQKKKLEDDMANMRSEMDKLKAAHEQAMADAAAAAEARYQKLSELASSAQRDMEESHKNKMQSLERRKEEERNKTVADLNEVHSATMKQLTEQHNDAINKLNDALAKARADKAAVEKQLSECERNLDAARVECNRLTSSLEAAHDTIEATEKRERERVADAVATGKKNVTEKERQMRSEHETKVAALQSEWDGVKAELLAKQKQLQRYIADLEYKIANRESRQEDVDKINELIRAMRTKDEELHKAHNDLKQYKLDLVNKETTYNKVFGRQPTVAAPMTQQQTNTMFGAQGGNLMEPAKSQRGTVKPPMR